MSANRISAVEAYRQLRGIIEKTTPTMLTTAGSP